MLKVQYFRGLSHTHISPICQQVVEENGVRRVVVVPHSGEFHPSMHPPPPPPPPHVPHYMHHPHALLPPPPHPVFPAVPGTGELPPQFMHQHPPPHVFQEQGEPQQRPSPGGAVSLYWGLISSCFCFYLELGLKLERWISCLFIKSYLEYREFFSTFSYLAKSEQKWRWIYLVTRSLKA